MNNGTGIVYFKDQYNHVFIKADLNGKKIVYLTQKVQETQVDPSTSLECKIVTECMQFHFDHLYEKFHLSTDMEFNRRKHLFTSQIAQQ